MSFTVTLVVLLAALLHASWNFLVKKADDKLLSMSAVVIGHVPFAVVVLCFVPLPDLAAWPYILASGIFHTGYQWFLLNAYRYGDLTQVYPLARGVAPLLVTLVSIVFLGVVFSAFELVAMGLIIAGILGLGLSRQLDSKINHQAALLALGTGGFIAAYSLVDGLGARVSGSPIAYYALGSSLNAVIWLVYMQFKDASLLKRLCTSHWQLTLQGGGASFAAYAMVVWAFTLAPIALVTALRETSILFATLLGVFVLGERLTRLKLFAIFTTLAGVLLLRLH